MRFQRSPWNLEFCTVSRDFIFHRLVSRCCRIALEMSTKTIATSLVERVLGSVALHQTGPGRWRRRVISSSKLFNERIEYYSLSTTTTFFFLSLFNDKFC